VSAPAPGTPLVSVVVPTYNSAAYIGECLDSVFRQSGPFALDVIVVDDGSTDDTVAQVRNGYPARCIEQANRGPAAARNVALGLARGDYVAFLDSDDLWPDGKLARQVEVLQRHPDVGLVFGDCRQFDENGPRAQTLFESGGLGAAFWGDPLYVIDPYAKLMRGNFITTGSIVMRRTCVATVGQFDESLRLVEDLEYWLRIALRYPIAHLDDVCLLRRRHAENTSRDPIAMSLAFLRVLEKHRQNHLADAKAQGASLRRRLAREYQELGHLHLRRGARTDAAGAYLRALRTRPSVRSLYYLLSALVARSTPGEAPQH
jgi:glycosyltransferase involved in cell wall biosynthesis